MSTYPVYRPRGGVSRLLSWADDFMNWFLYGHETWLVAVLKGVPLFLFVYFMLTYVPNYVYYLLTVELPFFRFSDDVGFLIANGIAGGNFALIILLALGVQAARGRRLVHRQSEEAGVGAGAVRRRCGCIGRRRLRVGPVCADARGVGSGTDCARAGSSKRAGLRVHACC